MKTMPVTLERLKAMAQDIAENGCGAPDCTECSHEPLFYLHPRCHLGAGVHACVVDEDVLRISCAYCGGFIADIGVIFPKPVENCCDDKLEVSYFGEEDFLRIFCYTCKKELNQMKVLSLNKNGK